MKRPLALAAFIFLSTISPSIVHADATDLPILDKAAAELRQQLRNPRTPPNEYWDRVAICESSLDGKTARWDDGGQFAGGLGIYIGTWTSWGGKQFAPRPNQATRIEQIVVANRIAVFGFQTKHDYMTLADRLAKRPYFRPKAGFFGWGCIANHKYLHPKRWVRKYGD